MTTSETEFRVSPIAILLRPKQWIKNGFVFAPLFFTPVAFSADNVVLVIGGFVSFCLLASSGYIVNDYLDRESDRQHPIKCSRPLAAGSVPTSIAIVLLALLLFAGVGLAALLSPMFAAVALTYVVVNIGYSVWLKHIAIVDVLVISLGFVLRVHGGAVLIQEAPSSWISIVTGLLALFLALAKRRDDLVKNLDETHRASLAGYNRQFLDVAISIILGALLVSYLIYTTDREVAATLGTENLYVTTPFVVGGVFRYLQLTFVEHNSGSPTALFFDPFLLACMGLWMATFSWLMFF